MSDLPGVETDKEAMTTMLDGYHSVFVIYSFIFSIFSLTILFKEVFHNENVKETLEFLAESDDYKSSHYQRLHFHFSGNYVLLFQIYININIISKDMARTMQRLK